MGHPILEAEVLYAARYEFCCSAEDFLLRRSRLAFLDVHTAGMVVPKVDPVGCWEQHVCLGAI